MAFRSLVDFVSSRDTTKVLVIIIQIGTKKAKAFLVKKIKKLREAD